MDGQQKELKATKEKFAFRKGSLQSTKDVASRRENELHASSAQLKDAVSHMEKELYTSNAMLRWFEYKLGETERQLGVAILHALNLDEVIKNLKAGVELQKELIAQVEDDAIDRRINASFKIF